MVTVLGHVCFDVKKCLSVIDWVPVTSVRHQNGTEPQSLGCILPRDALEFSVDPPQQGWDGAALRALFRFVGTTETEKSCPFQLHGTARSA